MINLLVDDIKGNSIDIITEWSKGVNVKITKISDLNLSEDFVSANDVLINLCAENNINVFLSFRDIDTEGHLISIVDKNIDTPLVPKSKIKMQVFSDKILDGFCITRSYYSILSSSYINQVLLDLETRYQIEKKSQSTNLSEIIPVKDNRKTSDTINNIINNKSKKKRKSKKKKREVN